MVGFPYYNDGCHDQIYLSNHVCDYAGVFAFVAVVVAFGGVSPAQAVDAVGVAALNVGDNKTKSVAAIAILGAIDAGACSKGYQCIFPAKDKMVETVSKNPKLVGYLACTAAIVWCARGVAERAVNQHF